MNKLFIVFLTVIAFTRYTLITPCGGSSAQFNINIQGCEDGFNAICVFIKGNTYRYAIDGISGTSAVTLNNTLAVLLGYPIPLFNTNVCADLQVGKCPIELGEQFVYEGTLINVTNSFPQTTGKMMFQTRNENEEVMSCGRFNFAIASANNAEADID